MSALSAHAEAARILAKSFADTAQEARNDSRDTSFGPDMQQAANIAGLTMAGMAESYRKAAAEMERKILEQCTGTDGRQG